MGHVDQIGAGLTWREQGVGPPVLFLHGLGGTRASWGPQLRELSNRFRCIAWDMPGYGGSDLVVPLTFPAIARRVIDLLDHLGLDTVDIVGLSFGGMHALHTALEFPDRVGRMVLADTSPAFGMDGTDKDEWVDARLGALDRGDTPAAIADAVVDAITEVTLTGRVRTEIVEAFASIPVEGFRAAVHCLPTNDVREQLASISHECLVIVGERDEETPVAYAQALAGGLPNAELHVMPGVGHLTPSEDPTTFNHLVANFLHR